MRLNGATLASFLIGASLLSAPTSRAQDSAPAPASQVVDLYRGAPILGAVEALRQKYNLAITYEDPVYACPCDLVDVSNIRKTPGPSLILPKREHIHFEFTEIDGKPQEDTTTLIRRLLAEQAAQGGSVFEVRERAMPSGTEWNVVPVRARDRSGSLVSQPDILGAPIFIPRARSTELQFLMEMLQQLRTETGYRVDLGSVQTRIDLGTAELGAENIPARDVLANLLGTRMVWDLNYDPEGGGRYVLNLVWTTPPTLPSLSVYTLPPVTRR